MEKYLPLIDEAFMITWTSIRDRSYTTDVWRAVAENDVSIVGKSIKDRGYLGSTVIFRKDEVSFHKVDEQMVQAIEQKTFEECLRKIKTSDAMAEVSLINLFVSKTLEHDVINDLLLPNDKELELAAILIRLAAKKRNHGMIVSGLTKYLENALPEETVVID